MKTFYVLCGCIITLAAKAQNVGIGVTSPVAAFQVAANKTVLFGQDSTTQGNKFIYFGLKAALRSGNNKSLFASVGMWSTCLGTLNEASGQASFASGSTNFANAEYSHALGLNNQTDGVASFASGMGNYAYGDYSHSFGRGNETDGVYSFATGIGNYVLGDYSHATGNSSSADGDSSFAMGNNTAASGTQSTAIGNSSVASGFQSTAIGNSTIASNTYSLAMGYQTTASGVYSTALGYASVASGDYSTAMGHYGHTNDKRGSFIIGDSDPYQKGYTTCSDNDQFVARFANGYYFVTSENITPTGVRIFAGGNAWLSISDKNCKENIENLDDENVLKKLSAITYSSWNYKGQDPKTFRHYGIMAQDFYQAFGKDNFGTIGCDTLVNPLDMQGVTFSAIKALEKRTQTMEELQEQVIELQKIVALLQKKITLSEKEDRVVGQYSR